MAVILILTLILIQTLISMILNSCLLHWPLIPSCLAHSTDCPANPIPPQQFYYDPTLYCHILQLEEQVQQLSGHAKMMEVELQNEKRWNNQQMEGQANNES
ncbi:hypothetical protein BJV74DRAFT_798197 [Russula compacta]|nr:hypothetical protein BJV74DRAFT_798197 [Russula compacta]